MMRVVYLAIASLFFSHPATAFDACATDAQATYQPVERVYTRGLLFKIEKCGIAPSYLFGTFHSDDPKYNALIIRVAAAVGKPNAGYFEIPVDAASNAKASEVMVLPEGRDLQSIVGEPLFAQTVGLLSAKGITSDIAARLTPWAAAILLQLPPNVADGKVIDEKIQTFFLKAGKPVIGLESLEEHFGVFTAIPPEQQKILLEEAIADDAQSAAANTALAEAYENEDLRTIDKLGDEAFAAIDDFKLRTYLQTKLLTERNIAMAGKLAAILPKGNVLVAVGALHLPDETGLIALLEKQGYYVTPVQP